MKKEIDSIIFDLGGVLIDWNPDYVYLNEFKGDEKKMNWFYQNICTMDQNENQDAGYPIKDATVPPSAGSTPIKEPMPLDLSIVFHVFL